MSGPRELGSIKSLRGNPVLPTIPKSGNPVLPTLGFAMIHQDVLTDPRLDGEDVRVYGILALHRRGYRVSVGGRRISSMAHSARQRVRESLKRLEDCGYAKSRLDARGKRATYELTEPRFAVPEFKEPVEVDFTPPLVTCPKCDKPCGGLLKVGWCRRCNRKVEMRDIARDVFREEAEADKIA